MMVTIYALTDPNGDVRYVGKTSKVVEYRLVSHYQEAKVEKYYKARWLKKLLSKGLKPGHIVLEVVDESEANGAEIKWIAHFRALGGRRLTNGTLGGEGGKMTPEVRAKWKATMRKKYETEPGPYTGKKHSNESKDKMSTAAKKRWKRGDGLSREHQSKASKARWAKPDSREKYREVYKITWTPEKLAAMGVAVKAHWTPERREQQATVMRRIWAERKRSQ